MTIAANHQKSINSQNFQNIKMTTLGENIKIDFSYQMSNNLSKKRKNSSQKYSQKIRKLLHEIRINFIVKKDRIYYIRSKTTIRIYYIRSNVKKKLRIFKKSQKASRTYLTILR